MTTYTDKIKLLHSNNGAGVLKKTGDILLTVSANPLEKDSVPTKVKAFFFFLVKKNDKAV